MTSSRTIAALLTPAGRGAVATVAIAGPLAWPTVAGLLVRPNLPPAVAADDWPLDRIGLARWKNNHGEEVVFARLTADRVEVHCHGGAMASALILDDLASHGLEVVPWSSWLSVEEEDPLAAEARRCLSAAVTSRTAVALLAQYRGALRRALEDVVDGLSRGQVAEARRQLTLLSERAAVGRHLVEPFSVVLAGPPNAGKSSLMNALAGFERAIVFDQPGTTRDALRQPIALDGWPVELIDTAGLHEAIDPLEQAGIARAQQAIERADLRLWLFDGSRPWHRAWNAPLERWPGLVLRTKCDLPALADAARPPSLAISCVSGQGLRELEAEMISRLVPNCPPPDAALPFLPHHAAALDRALAALAASDVGAAQQTLREVLGGRYPTNS